MPGTEFFLLGVFRSLAEVAGLFLLGQGVLYVLAGQNRDKNGVYRLFQIVTSPVIRIVRALAPKLVADRLIPFIAFFLLFALWIGLAYVRRVL
jgi:hypothetical protein